MIACILSLSFRPHLSFFLLKLCLPQVFIQSSSMLHMLHRGPGKENFPKRKTNEGGVRVI